jgi:hypothetical protein
MTRSDSGRIEPFDEQYAERVGDLFIQKLEIALRAAAITGVPVTLEQQKDAHDWAVRVAADQLDEELNSSENRDYPDHHEDYLGAG